MSKIKIQVLKDFEASTDGINIQPYKQGEILQLGTPKLSLSLLEWFERNQGYGNFIAEPVEALIAENKVSEEKVINQESEINAAENVIPESKSEEVVKVTEVAEVSEPAAKEESLPTYKLSPNFNPFKKRK